MRSASRLKLCGAIFDAPAKQIELDKLEKLIGSPDFWNQPEQSQKVMQERKRLEEALSEDSQITTSTSDLETLFELAREGEDVNGDIDSELKKFAERLEKLETGMLLSGENDHAAQSSRSTPAQAAPKARIGPRCCSVCICAGRSATDSKA